MMAAMFLCALVLFSTCFFGAFADPAVKDPLAFKNATWGKCQKQENVPEDIMNDFYFFRTTERLVDYKCAVKCIQDEYGMWKDGTLQMDVLEKIVKGLWNDPVTQQKLMVVVEGCIPSDDPGAHKCQKYYDQLDCFMKGAKKGNINIIVRRN